MTEIKNILIVGAGKAGKLLQKDIIKNHPECKVVGFADDFISHIKDGTMLGKIDDIAKINKTYKIDEMIIAIPSTNGGLVRKVLLNNIHNRIPIKIVPRNQKIIILSSVNYVDIKNIVPEDFLGRPFINKNVEKLKKFYNNKIIFVTGGAGSIGSEIVRQLIDLEVKKVIVYDNSEYLIFNLDQNLKENNVPSNKYKLIIGNILNREKLDHIITDEKPDIIFHAAAYKHVHLMEDNIDEAILNNVHGSKNVIDSAVKNNVKLFTFISTDKAVKPTSVMGATKKLCEYYICNIDTKKTRFNIVRFGNVINSNGSVIPLFERQIENWKSVTLTHKDIMRFFMSIREAAQLVIESLVNDFKHSIYVLNMGELIKIKEVAECLIRSRNMIPGEDVEIKITGLRKGEKMTEELYTDTEKNKICTCNKHITRLKNVDKCPVDIIKVFDELINHATKHADKQKTLKKHLKDFFPSLKLK